MALTIRTTGSSEYGRFVRTLVVGFAGSGKTRFGSNWPNPFYADADGGLMSVADRGLPYSVVTSTDDMKELRAALDQAPADREKAFGCPVDTLVIDTFDGWQDIIIKERLKATKLDALRIQDYGWLAERCKEIVLGFRNLPINLVCLCHLRDMGGDGEDETSTRMPALAGQIREKITEYMDLSVVLKAQTISKIVDNKSERVLERYLMTRPDKTHPWIKDRSGKLPPEFPINFDDDFQRLHQLIFSGIADLPDTSERSLTMGKVLDLGLKPEAPASRPQPVGPKARVKPAPANTPPAGVDPDTGEVVSVEPQDVVVDNEQLSAVLDPTPSDTEESKCEDCGGLVTRKESVMSKIRFRAELCDKCFRARPASNQPTNKA